MVEAVLYKDQTKEGRERLDILLHGPPTEEQWAADPLSMTAQLPPDAMGGEAP